MRKMKKAVMMRRMKVMMSKSYLQNAGGEKNAKGKKLQMPICQNRGYHQERFDPEQGRIFQAKII